MEVPDDLIRELYHAAFCVAYYAKDECKDYKSSKKKYWFDLGIKIEQLYQAVEKYGSWEVRQSPRHRQEKENAE